MRRFAVLVLLALYLLGSPDVASAAIVMHRQIHVEDGLAQSQVNAVLEASDGQVWFGTFGGVSRWDGTRFENFELQDGLAGLDVRAFHETASGDMLISTADNGICRYRAGKFTIISTEQGLPAVSTRGFHLAEDGQLYVATADGLFIFSDESLDLATARHELPGVRVSGIAHRRAGGFYLSTFSDGVLVWDGSAAEPLVPVADLPSKIIRAVHEEPDGTVLISVYHSGVWSWRDGVLSPFRHNELLAGHDVMAFTQASDGALYLPTINGGVAVCRGGRCELLTEVNGLANNTSWAVHEGSGGTIYFGTWGGVSIYHPGRFLTLNAASGLPQDSATATVELPDGTMVIAMVDGGISFFDGERIVRSLGAADGLEHDRVWSLLVAHDGSLYIGTHMGLNRWQNGRLTTVFREAEAPHGRIYGMYETADGVLWLATYGGIRKIVNGRPETIYDEPNARRSTVYSVAETDRGDLLFGTASGLVTVRNGEVVLPAADSPLADAHIWSIHQGRDGAVYLGTNGAGLLVARQGRPDEGPLEALGTTEGLSSNTIFGIAEDAGGRLFLATQRGVSIVTPGAEVDATRQIHSADGLAGEECNPGGCFADSRGRFWFGTIRGVTCYDPARDLPVTQPPCVHWQRVRLFAEELPLSLFAGVPVFGHRDNFFHFDFVAANPRAPHKVRYRHRLSGVDRGWIEDRQTSVAYTSLPAATYAFEVMACNEWGFWSEPVSLDFRITPPFWKTWWFIILAVLASAGPVVVIAFARVRHLLAYEQLRTKIAADLHDDIGAGLTEISIVSRVLAQKLPAAQCATVQGELGQLGETSRQLVRSMSDIVWLVHPQRDSLHDLVSRLADANQHVFRAAEIDFRVDNLDSLAELRLGMERRQHLYLIFKEAINNAVKYSGCRVLRLAIGVDRNWLTMTLRDDGTGFATTPDGQGNGLRNMRERAKKLGAELTIESAPGAGCAVTLRSRSQRR